MSKRALRCLAFAIKTGESLGDLETYDGDARHPGRATLADPSGYESVESGLTFVGVAGLPRSSSTGGSRGGGRLPHRGYSRGGHHRR